MSKKNQILRLSIFLFFTLFVGLWLGLFLSGCTPTTQNNRVVLYCSVDSVFARPLIKQLEAKTGLQIDVIFDTEATKTAGLANKIRAEKERPRADVFWSSALLQTLLMSDEGLLEKYDSPAAKDLPARFQGEGWAGVGVRGRVLTTWMPMSVGRSLPDSLAFIPQDDVPDSSAAFSNPQFGTASDNVTAWATRHGKDWVLKWFTDFKRGKRRLILPGNGDVVRAVDPGETKDSIDYGWTDTDDFLAQSNKKSSDITTAPTTKDNVLVPGAVSILKNSPNPENAKKLFDAIVSAENEANLVKEMPGVFSLRQMKQDSNWDSNYDFTFLKNAPEDDYTKWPQVWRELREPLNQILKK